MQLATRQKCGGIHHTDADTRRSRHFDQQLLAGTGGDGAKVSRRIDGHVACVNDVVVVGTTPAMIAIHSSTDLGQAARAARKRLGLTQPQLALAAGVGVRFIVEMEAGKPSLRLSSVLQVLGALGGQLAVEGLEGLDDELPAASATALTAQPSKPASKID